ncbi:MAG: FAD-binding oxidoreductase [Jatrophihabitans sp.]|uniref:FAD-binding oxidoreductase n=1 Tax=Jatrophihabitans sp. TaxID=1932789 RepID=UPI003F7EDE5E
MTLVSNPTALDRLATDLDGLLVRPSDAAWDTARAAWHLAVDQQPAAVVLAQTVRDVVATVDTARELGLRVAPQGTGHNAAPLGDLSGSILLRTSAMRGVEVDPARRIVRAEAGAWWIDVTTAAAPHGLAALAGSAADVGVVGYTLGGGLSWFGRSHGLAANTVVAFDVVTADGRQRRVDADHEPDLFWALRGGNGNVAIVTAIELQLFPISEVYAGVLFFPVERAEQVLQTWRALLPTLPEEITSVGRILRFPPLPDLPPHLAGRAFVVVEAASQRSAADTDALLAPLRALGPEFDTFGPMSMPALAQLHMDPPGPVPGYGDGVLVDGLDADAVRAFVAVSEQCGPALLSLELRHLGGALRPDRGGDGAYTGIPADLALFAVGITPTPEAMQATRAAVQRVRVAMTPWSNGRAYGNFAEERVASEAIWGDAAGRLAAIRQAFDPHGVLHANHPAR